MGDLIDRQDAIDAVDQIIARDASGNNDVVNALTAWRICITGLPSAQSEIIRCNDCKYYKAHDYTGYLACHLVLGVKVRRDPDDFCSRGVRREDG